MSRIPISLQLYSVGGDFAADMEKTFLEVRTIGYKAVEFAGFCNYPAQRVREALKNNDLWVSGAHVGIEELSEENFEKTVVFHKEVGNNVLVVPWIEPKNYETFEAIKKTAEMFNNLAEKAKKFDVTVGYHNHHEEFFDLPDAPGKTAWTALREETVPEFLMQFDTGNARFGNADVNKEILTAPGRLQIVHLKPFSDTHGYTTFLGARNDNIDYKTILPFMLNEGKTHTIVIEYSCKDLFPDMQGAKICFDGLVNNYNDLLQLAN